MPPKQPTMPVITPMTGTCRRSAMISAWISATTASPRLASCRRTPPVSSRSTGRIGFLRLQLRPAGAGAAAVFLPGPSPHPAALERPLDRHDHGGPAGELPARDDDAVIRLGHDPLERKPGRFHT